MATRSRDRNLKLSSVSYRSSRRRRQWKRLSLKVPIFSALPRVSTGRSTPLCKMFWREMTEYGMFTTTISNSVDARGVCWLFGWGYFNDQSANKTRKKAENLKFEIWFTDNRDVHLKVSLKMLILYFSESRSCMWRRSWDIRNDKGR